MQTSFLLNPPAMEPASIGPIRNPAVELGVDGRD
jgi:hypothetical protein